MSVKWVKTGIVSIFGVVIICIGLYYYLFRTFQPSVFLNGVYHLNMDEKLLHDLEYVDGHFQAIGPDAWFQVNLPVKQQVKLIQIGIRLIDVKDKSQIYHTDSSDFSSDKYFDKTLSKGNNTIELEETLSIRSLRFDITANAGETFSVDYIKIVISDSIKTEYVIFCFLLSVLFLIVSFVMINKTYIYGKILNNKNYYRKFQLADQIISLSISDFKNRFSGSYLGICWGILQPLSTILLFWFVFQIGFRSQPIEDVPFILWLAAGMIPWNYFYDAWFGGTSAFTSYSYIVKKVVFKVELLPLVKVISSSILNLIFNGILLFIYALYGKFPGLHLVDMIYYSFCLFALTLGLSYITATLNVFIKDIGQFLGIVLQFLMWMTPMMWVYTTIPEKYSWFYKLNPLHYIINGYRESMINGYWFFHNYKRMIWFWLVTICFITIGHKLLKKMKPHFADIL